MNVYAGLIVVLKGLCEGLVVADCCFSCTYSCSLVVLQVIALLAKNATSVYTLIVFTH